MNKRGRFDQPLYNSVRSAMLAKLSSGEWVPGAKIPTEPELAKMFSVSIGTVRKAVEDLVAEKVLLRRARIGTTVARHDQHNQFSTFFNFADPSGNSKMLIEPKLLALKKVVSTKELSKIFNVHENDSFFMIDNLRLINGHPVMYDRLWLPHKKFSKLTQKGFENRLGSIYSLYQTQFGLTVVRIKEHVEAIKVPEFVREELGLKKTDAILKITRFAYTYGDELIEYRNRYVNTNLSLYQNELGLKE